MVFAGKEYYLGEWGDVISAGVLLAGGEGVLEGCCLLGERECWRSAACWGGGSVGGVLPAWGEGVLEECRWLEEHCLLGEREC